MKYLPAFLLGSIFLSLNLTAQKAYAPLGAEWKYEGHSIDCSGHHQKFTVVNEKVIDGKNCSVIHSFLWSDNNVSWEIKDSLTVWEDANKVYFWEDTSFYLLYDFDASLGDTVFAFDPINKQLFSATFSEEMQTTPNSVPYIIEGVDEINISGVTHKVYETSPPENLDNCTNHFQIIENIGSTSWGFAGVTCYHVLMGCFGQIVCYRNELINYEPGFLNCDDLVKTTIIEESPIVIYPNPVSEKIMIDNPSNEVIESFEIFTMTGKSCQSGAFSTEIDVSQLSAGIYLLQLRLEGSFLVSKKMIVN